jgi:hypothetical protein
VIKFFDQTARDLIAEAFPTFLDCFIGGEIVDNNEAVYCGRRCCVRSQSRAFSEVVRVRGRLAMADVETSSAIKALICMRCRRSVTPDRGLLLSWSLITIGLATLVMCGSFCCGRLAFLAAAAARVRLPAIMEYWKEGRRRKKRCHYGNSKTFYVVSRTLRRSPGGCVLYSGLA